jgi:S1-C subfamily serine protease
MKEVNLLLKITTVIICKEGRKNIGSGTGFFFRDNNQLYLVTNRHVFIDEEKNFFPDKVIIKLNTDEHNLTVSKEVSYDLYVEEEQKWLELKGVDLAILPIKDPEGCILAALARENIAPRSLKLGLGEQVIVIGYPRGFYDDLNNLPITRNATIASAYGINFKGNQFFLIDSVLHPGTSGSPVITVPKNIISSPGGGMSIAAVPQWSFLGINSGSYGDLQLNTVWYAQLVIEIIDKNNKKEDSSKVQKT